MDLYLIQQFDLVDKPEKVKDNFVVLFRKTPVYAGITHTEQAQLGFIRSLTRFFLDSQNGKGENTDKFQGEHTIDQLYQIVHPDWTNEQVKLHTYPLKKIIDTFQMTDALVDLSPSTKNLPSAHFDSESFAESNHRLMQLRKKSKSMFLP